MAQPPSELGPSGEAPAFVSPRPQPLMPAHVSCQDQAGENYCNQGSRQLVSATTAPVGTAAHVGAAAMPPPQQPQWLLAPHEGQPAGSQMQELPEAAVSKALPASAFGSPRCPYAQKGTRPGSNPGTSPPAHPPPLRPAHLRPAQAADLRVPKGRKPKRLHCNKQRCPTQPPSVKLPPGWPPRDWTPWPPGTPQLSRPHDSQCKFGSRERPGSQVISFSNQAKEVDIIQPVRPGARHTHVQVSKGVQGVGASCQVVFGSSQKQRAACKLHNITFRFPLISMLQIKMLVLQSLPFSGESVDMDPRCSGLLPMSCCCRLDNIAAEL